MEAIEFTEQQIVDEKNRFAPFDARMLPKNGKGAEHRTGYCTRCGGRSYPYALCRKHREYGSVKRSVDRLVDAGVVERLTDGRGKKGGAKYITVGAVKQKPYVRKDIRVGRNAICPCGSCKKYKKCCGK